MSQPTIQKTFIRHLGSKWRIAPWIISHFPREYNIYVEPFGGSASVLFQKEKSKVEIYNDLDSRLFNLFKVVRDDVSKLKEMLRLTLWSRDEFELACNVTDDPIEQARRTIVLAWMGFRGNTGEPNPPFRCGIRWKGISEAKGWSKYPKTLQEVHERLKDVIIENQPALKLLKKFDKQDTIFYLDPPYMHNTRTNKKNHAIYKHEMKDEDHKELLDFCLQSKAMILISGYDNPLYNDKLKRWRKLQKNVQASGFSGSVKRTECLWINPQAQIQRSLF